MRMFSDAGKKEAPHAQLTGVQEAPRHEKYLLRAAR